MLYLDMQKSVVVSFVEVRKIVGAITYIPLLINPLTEILQWYVRSRLRTPVCRPSSLGLPHKTGESYVR